MARTWAKSNRFSTGFYTSFPQLEYFARARARARAFARARAKARARARARAKYSSCGKLV